jgi:transposase
MDAHEDTPRIQVLSVSDTGRRRRWTDAEKIRIVEESLGGGVTLAEVARRHDVSRSQLYDWRYRHKHGLLGSGPQFLRVLKIEDASDGPDIAPAPQVPVMTIDLGPRCRVTIPSGFDMEAAAHLLNGLMVRS